MCSVSRSHLIAFIVSLYDDRSLCVMCVKTNTFDREHGRVILTLRFITWYIVSFQQWKVTIATLTISVCIIACRWTQWDHVVKISLTSSCSLSLFWCYSSSSGYSSLLFVFIVSICFVEAVTLSSFIWQQVKMIEPGRWHTCWHVLRLHLKYFKLYFDYASSIINMHDAHIHYGTMGYLYILSKIMSHSRTSSNELVKGDSNEWKTAHLI